MTSSIAYNHDPALLPTLRSVLSVRAARIARQPTTFLHGSVRACSAVNLSSARC